MNANELRIGNYILLGDEIVEVESIALNKGVYNIYFHSIQSTTNATFPIDSFELIPLTEEILLKCGFEKRETNEDGVVYGILNTTIIYAMKMNGGFGYYLNGYHNDVELQYLHQLQNLYFALTGKELNITL